MLIWDFLGFFRGCERPLRPPLNPPVANQHKMILKAEVRTLFCFTFNVMSACMQLMLSFYVSLYVFIFGQKLFRAYVVKMLFQF